MKITTVGRKFHVTDDLKELVTKKLSKFDRYFPKGADATVTFRRVRDNECMEITISVVGTLFRAEESSADFRTSLARCIDVIEGQIRKNKTKLAKRLRENVIDMSVVPDPVEDIPEEEPIIRVKQFEFKPMTAEEAIMQMNLLGHSFYVFNDIATGDTCVVYTRKDGDYGLIEPMK